MHSRSSLVLVLPIVLATLLLSACSLPIYSESELESESGEAFQEMRAQIPAATDARLIAYVNCVSADIVQQLEKPYSEEDWEVVLFESDDINAFAIRVAVAENQDQLAAVIGHEVAHVTLKHSLKRANREATTQGGVILGTAVLGAGPGVGDLVSMGAQLGLSLPFSRANETEADTIGLNYMADAGFNPSASIQLWKNMAAKNKLGAPQFLSTHPSGDSRIQDLVRQLPEALKRYNAAQAAGRKPNCQR